MYTSHLFGIIGIEIIKEMLKTDLSTLDIDAFHFFFAENVHVS